MWSSGGSPGTDQSSYSIQGQRYASNGSALGGQFQVNSYTTSQQLFPSVTPLPSGDFVVVWSSVAIVSDWNIEGQRFASNGAPLGVEFEMNSYTTSFQKYPNVAKASNGDFVVVWQSNGSFGTDSSSTSIEGQLFASDGTPLGDEFQVNTYTTGQQILPSLAREGDGNFLVTWQSAGRSGAPMRLR